MSLNCSNTVSNITFGSFHFTAAQELGLLTQIIITVQTVGGAIGNIIAIHNVVAALATVGLVGQEGHVIRFNLILVLYYTICAGISSLVFTYVLFPNVVELNHCSKSVPDSWLWYPLWRQSDS